MEEPLRFYLHIKDGKDLIRDEEGVDLPTAADARDQHYMRRASWLRTLLSPGVIWVQMLFWSPIRMDSN
jgi:hypothetical protein